MKQIQPVSIWYNGAFIPATLFSLNCISDNLIDTAIFYYCLYSDNNIKLGEGNLTMTGEDYGTYTTSSDSNAYAFEWGANELKLIII